MPGVQHDAAAESVATAREPAPAGARRRRDIQGVRAVAVLLVVAYHLRPEWLPGGFVGVDVFFVVSGFLILGSLAREASGSGTVRLLRFYAHRARRLLPASGLVIVTTVVAAMLVLPMTRWEELSRSAIASALSVQNLVLAFGASEYAAASAAVSPFQHFWSLSLEEQFYLVAPLVVLSVAVLGPVRRRAAGLVRPLVVVLGALGAASFVWSIWYTQNAEGAAAYYSTLTRVWELLLGGVVALCLPRITAVAGGALASRTAGWVGLVLILGSAVLIDGVDGFPGALALAPTLGTALVLLSGSVVSDRTGSVGAVLSGRLPVYVGDISYSLYLWHWPVIVLTAAVTGHPRASAREVLLLLAVSGALAAASERWVERPFRRPWRVPGRLSPARAWRRRARPQHARRGTGTMRDGSTIVVASTVVLAALTVGSLPAWGVHQETRAANVRLEEARQEAGTMYPGARSLMPGFGPPPPSAPVIPDPVVAMQDLPVVYKDGCNALDVATIAASDTACRYGAARPTTGTMVVLGDSHAAQFVAPLDRIAQQQGRELLVLFRDGCPFSLDLGAWTEQGCVPHNQEVMDLLLSDPPAVAVVANLSEVGYQSALQWQWPEEQTAAKGFEEAWAPLVAAGTKVFYVRPIPYPSFDGPGCVADHGPTDPRCSMTPPGANDPLPGGVEEAQRVSGVLPVDLRPAICAPSACRAVEGNVLVFRDNHLSETYALTLEDSLAEQMAARPPDG